MGIPNGFKPGSGTNVAELYDMNGDLHWVKTHQLSCEKALDWLLKETATGTAG